jgi:hypothetical protein
MRKAGLRGVSRRDAFKVSTERNHNGERQARDSFLLPASHIGGVLDLAYDKINADLKRDLKK